MSCMQQQKKINKFFKKIKYSEIKNKWIPFNYSFKKQPKKCPSHQLKFVQIFSAHWGHQLPQTISPSIKQMLKKSTPVQKRKTFFTQKNIKSQAAKTLKKQYSINIASKKQRQRKSFKNSKQNVSANVGNDYKFYLIDQKFQSMNKIRIENSEDDGYKVSYVKKERQIPRLIKKNYVRFNKAKDLKKIKKKVSSININISNCNFRNSLQNNQNENIKTIKEEIKSMEFINNQVLQGQNLTLSKFKTQKKISLFHLSQNNQNQNQNYSIFKQPPSLELKTINTQQKNQCLNQLRKPLLKQNSQKNNIQMQNFFENKIYSCRNEVIGQNQKKNQKTQIIKCVKFMNLQEKDNKKLNSSQIYNQRKSLNYLRLQKKSSFMQKIKRKTSLQYSNYNNSYNQSEAKKYQDHLSIEGRNQNSQEIQQNKKIRSKLNKQIKVNNYTIQYQRAGIIINLISKKYINYYDNIIKQLYQKESQFYDYFHIQKCLPEIQQQQQYQIIQIDHPIKFIAVASYKSLLCNYNCHFYFILKRILAKFPFFIPKLYQECILIKGLVGMWLWKNGWKCVTMNTKIIVNYQVRKLSLWQCILQKAYLKLYGLENFKNLDCNMLLQSILGCPGYKIKIEKNMQFLLKEIMLQKKKRRNFQEVMVIAWNQKQSFQILDMFRQDNIIYLKIINSTQIKQITLDEFYQFDYVSLNPVNTQYYQCSFQYGNNIYMKFEQLSIVYFSSLTQGELIFFYKKNNQSKYIYESEKKLKGYCRMLLNDDNLIINKGQGNFQIYSQKKPVMKQIKN